MRMECGQRQSNCQYNAIYFHPPVMSAMSGRVDGEVRASGGGWDFKCFVTLFPPLVVVPPPRPTQNPKREGELTIADRIVIAQLGYRHVRKSLHLVKN